MLGWLWRRFYAAEDIRRNTPRRLIYCLPMRTLVEQTARTATDWVARLGLKGSVSVHVLMGGEGAEDWDLHPEADAILVGTQDMLLSRALNRGYAMSRYRWPLPFALLHNDALWVLDEVQLMDVGVATSAQMEGFRRSMEVFGPAHSVWMSATLQQSWLETVDLPKGSLGWRLELGQEDLQDPYVNKLWNAPKPLIRSEASMGDAAKCAEAIAAAHQSGTKTLAVFNTVKQATAVFERLAKRKDIPRPVLLHSRFRPDDRKQHLKALLEREEVIAVSTQVVEAGVDVSATTLLTELAPWASLVQRFGRCNRRGEDKNACIIWFDPGELADKAKEAPPYEVEDLRAARVLLQGYDDVSLASLEQIKAQMPLRADHVLRRRDLIDLFDTTPDLAGNDIDISRFIRSDDEHHVKVFWRTFETKPDDQPAPQRDELCSAPVGELKSFRKGHRSDVWRWDGLDEGWRRVEEREIYAGQIYMIHAAAGGYTAEAGWNAKSKDEVEPVGPPGEAPDDHFPDHQIGAPLKRGIARRPRPSA